MFRSPNIAIGCCVAANVLALVVAVLPGGFLGIFGPGALTVALGAMVGLWFAFTLRLAGHRTPSVICAGLALSPWFVIILLAPGVRALISWIAGTE